MSGAAEHLLDLAGYVARTDRDATVSPDALFRRGKRTSWHHYAVRPVYTFMYRYVIRLGVLAGSGWRGRSRGRSRTSSW